VQALKFFRSNPITLPLLAVNQDCLDVDDVEEKYREGGAVGQLSLHPELPSTRSASQSATRVQPASCCGYLLSKCVDALTNCCATVKGRSAVYCETAFPSLFAWLGGYSSADGTLRVYVQARPAPPVTDIKWQNLGVTARYMRWFVANALMLSVRCTLDFLQFCRVSLDFDLMRHTSLLLFVMSHCLFDVRSQACIFLPYYFNLLNPNCTCAICSSYNLDTARHGVSHFRTLTRIWEFFV
jgi:hypothetical protein